MPDRFTGGMGIFLGQGIGQIHLAVAGGQVFFVEQANAFHQAQAGAIAEPRGRRAGEQVRSTFAPWYLCSERAWFWVEAVTYL